MPGEMSIRREQSSNSTVSKLCWSFDIPIWERAFELWQAIR